MEYSGDYFFEVDLEFMKEFMALMMYSLWRRRPMAAGEGLSLLFYEEIMRVYR